MNLISIIFYLFIVIASASAFCMLFVKNVFYAALLLIACLLSVAGIFILNNFEFLAAVQIMIYAGGVLVLIIFGLMLTAKVKAKPLQVGHQNIIPGTLVGLAFFGVLTYSYANLILTIPLDVQQTNNSVNSIGILLMTDYVLPFEVSGILLLISLIGAAITASSFSLKQ
jgi:NADH:ubiquinone oxidoreductase subunit 6 (subunit J)